MDDFVTFVYMMFPKGFYFENLSMLQLESSLIFPYSRLHSRFVFGNLNFWIATCYNHILFDVCSVQALIKLINRDSNLGSTRRGYGCNTNAKKDTGA
jgi:hypothetical protein